jgi:hypothetical protein
VVTAALNSERDMNKLKRNDPCYCGSGQKYKKCHMNIDAGWHYNAKSNSWYKPEPVDEKKEQIEKLVIGGAGSAAPLITANMGENKV